MGVPPLERSREWGRVGTACSAGCGVNGASPSRGGQPNGGPGNTFPGPPVAVPTRRQRGGGVSQAADPSAAAGRPEAPFG
ncbi:hypothetical protein C4B68_13900 [Streptomyces dengpaensis]|uniref:Uncharacterized protein n=1 Tax=Streptomyces dengpaensis TaxID=2049881 RepID=A0ABM6SPR5_9ACTN|nr:hypothetical protein C4B68_13900 [Streptomyces dengpaensis]